VTETPHSQTPEEIEADIERQREALGQTVDALAAKLDVKAQARQRAQRVADRATTDDGRPRPELLAVAGAVVLVVVALVVVRRRR
jgi:MYXO-CTERM domain-containing protein